MFDLKAFLETLNERDRSVFIRRYYRLEEPFEIGEKYGIKEDYVRTILMRVRKKLKKYLKEVRT
jgi:RNA polymerase sigma factor (sigma-70 family)